MHPVPGRTGEGECLSLIEILNQYSGLIALVGSLGGGAIALYLRTTISERTKGLVTTEQLDAVIADVEDLTDRTTTIEATLKHLPDTQALQDLALNVTELRGDLKTTAAEMAGVKDLLETLSRQVQVMDGFLRNLK